MRVTITRGGGLAGLVRVVAADSNQLGKQDQERLADLVQATRAATGATGPSTDMHPDEFGFEVAVEGEGGSERWSFPETSLPEPARTLASWLAEVPGHTEHLEPPGSSTA